MRYFPELNSALPNFRVRDTFHKDFSIFAIRHNFKSQTELLHELFELGKEKYEGPGEANPKKNLPVT